MSTSVVVVVVVLAAAALVGGAVSIVLVARAGREHPALLEADPITPRLVAEVHAGEEQVLIHLTRSLGVAPGRRGTGYGDVYLAGADGSTMRLATRSEIGRGFDGEIRVRRGRRSSVVEYFVLRLPGDDGVLDRVRGLDLEITEALRALDPSVRIEGAAGSRAPS